MAAKQRLHRSISGFQDNQNPSHPAMKDPPPSWLPPFCLLDATLLGRHSAVTCKGAFHTFSASSLYKAQIIPSLWNQLILWQQLLRCGVYSTAVQQLYTAMLQQSCSYSRTAQEVEWLHMTPYLPLGLSSVRRKSPEIPITGISAFPCPDFSFSFWWGKREVWKKQISLLCSLTDEVLWADR